MKTAFKDIEKEDLLIKSEIGVIVYTPQLFYVQALSALLCRTYIEYNIIQFMLFIFVKTFLIINNHFIIVKFRLFLILLLSFAYFNFNF